MKHPVGMPPIHRGSMPATPWLGLRRGLELGLGLGREQDRALGAPGRRIEPKAIPAFIESGSAAAEGVAPAQAWQLSDAALNPDREAWEAAAARRRRWLMGWVLLATALASGLLWHAQPMEGPVLLRGLQMGLFALLFAWVSAGCVTAVMGFIVLIRGDRHALSASDAGQGPIDAGARTAVVMPICNEDVATVFAGLRASCESMAGAGLSALMDVFVLSDTGSPDLRAAEMAAWQALREHLAASGHGVRVYYRWRQRRTRRKAGNVADFCRRWGRDYRYMVVLDADSVMSGEALGSLVRLMEAHPRAGILQTAPRAVGLDTLHARAQQFTSRVTGRLFTAGMQFWQLGEAHYWGHNAIIRIAPFMRHCGLAPLPGSGALAGDILSHDFVEAALMRRAGYQVWLVSDIAGSYEQQPPHLLAELQRDRRWCQGNLQNARLIAEPGLKAVHRAMLATGAMAYLSAPLWLLYVAIGLAMWVSEGHDAWQFGQAFSPPGSAGLWAATATMLALPRLLGLLAVLWRREQGQFGGALKLAGSTVLEALLSMLQAPLRMAAHSLFVVGGLTGWTLDWKSPPREAAKLRWSQAARPFALVSLAALALAVAVHGIAPSADWWLLPLALPWMLAVPFTVWSSRPALGAALRRRGWLMVPEECVAPGVLDRAWSYARQPPVPPRWGWRGPAELSALAALVRQAMGMRATAQGLRGERRFRQARRWMEDFPERAPDLGERMRLLSEPHSLQLLKTAQACAPVR